MGYPKIKSWSMRKIVSSELTDADYREGCGETCRDERRCKCGQGYDERTRAHQVDGVLSRHRLPMAMSSRDDSLDCTQRCLQAARHL